MQDTGTNAGGGDSDFPAPIELNVNDPKSTRSVINSVVGISDDYKAGNFVSDLLPFAYVAGGLILFVMLLWGGFEMLMNATDTKAQDSGKNRIMWALIGFLLLFSSYWIAQVIEIALGVTILGK
jgi:hypothetical protein